MNNNNYIFNKITAIPKGITTLVSSALLMLFAFLAMTKGYFNSGHNEALMSSVNITLFLGFLLLVIVPITKRLSFRIGLRKATLLTMIVAACFGYSTQVQAQAPNAAQAVQICDGIWPEPGATASIGTNDFPNAASDGCLFGEHGSNWYYVQVTTSGTMAFSVQGLTAAGLAADIDGAVWGPFASVAAGASAINVSGQAPIRCSYSQTSGIELRPGVVATTETQFGTGVVQSIPVTAGQYYLIFVDNYAAGTVNGAVSISWNFTSGNTAVYACPAMPATCGLSCSAATCPVSDRGVTKSGVQNAGVLTFSQCSNYFATPFKAGDGTFTQCYTVTSGANGNLGVVQQISVRGTDGPDADVFPDCTAPIAASRTATLTLASAACGTAIPPITTNAGNSSTFNPEWSGLTPNTSYVLCISTTMPAPTAGVVCNYRQSCVDVYHWAPAPISPGCTATGPAVWIKANAGTNTTVEDAQVTSWTNYGTAGGNVTGGTGTFANSIAYQTTSPTYKKNTFNFNPAVFANSTAGMGMINALPANPARLTVYYVNKLGDITTWKSHVGLSDATALGTPVGILSETVMMSNNATPYVWQGASNGATNPIAFTTDKPYINGWSWAGAGQGLANSINGRAGNTGSALAASNRRSFFLAADPDGGAEDGGRGDGTYYAEAVVFDQTLTAAEHQRVQSYLAIKYGITLDQTVATNYFSSNATIWDATANATYKNNIFGIGSDLCQALSQKQSMSIESGFQPILSTTTFAETNAANTTDLADKSFEMSGSDAGVADFGTSYAFSGMTHRMTRIWKIQETGTVGLVKVAIEKALVAGNAGNLNLLRSTDAIFDNSDTKVAMTTEIVGGIEYYTATIDFANGDFYTFGAYATSPGCVAGNLKAWFKADAGISNTDGAKVASWTNAVDNTYNVTQVTTGNQPTYYSTNKENIVNFNPTIGFTANGNLRNTNRLYSNTTPFSIISVGVDRKAPGALGATLGIGSDGNYPGFDLQKDGVSPNNGWNFWIWGSSPLEYGGGTGVLSNGGDYNKQTDIYALTSNNVAAGTDNIISYINGTKDLTNMDAARTGEIGNQLWIGSSGGDSYWNGLIPEVIVYDKQLTDVEMQRVQSYLSIKYGNTLAQDYLAGDGTKIWDKTAYATYHNNVFGIARDDCQGLNQKQSKSDNVFALLTIGNGTGIAATNTANTNVFAADKSFEMVGDNGLVAGYVTAYAPTSFTPAKPFKRMARVWRVDETGTVGNVTVKIKSNATHILVDNDGDAIFGNGTVTEVALTNGEASVNFADGATFTFGREVAPFICNDGVAFIHGDDAVNSSNNSTLGISAWKSNGDGTFSQTVIRQGGFNRDNTGTEVFGDDVYSSTYAADVNGDGAKDIVHVTENNSNSIYVYLNNRNNTFATNPIVTTGIAVGTNNGFAGESGGEQGWMGDANNDGKIDYLFSGNDSQVHVYFGNGDGTFQLTRVSTTLIATGYQTSGRSVSEEFLAQDVNGDGSVDIVGTYDPGKIIVWLGNGDGTFIPNPYIDMAIQDSGASNSSGSGDNEYSQFADADGDGDLDYMHAEIYESTSQIWAFLNNGDGTFATNAVLSQATTQPLGGAFYYSNYNASEQSYFQDINGDGKADYITTRDNGSVSENGIAVYLATAGGSYAVNPITTIIPAGFATGTSASETSFITCGFIRDCNAGTNEPAFSISTIIPVSPATTVDLTTLTPTNLPVGTTLTWHTMATATDANKVATPAAALATGTQTYYAAFYDATNRCYSTVTAPIGTVPVPGCVAAGLDFWLDPSKSVTKTGTAVTAWADADGGGNNPALTQTTAALQPSHSDGDVLSNFNPYINFTNNQRLNTDVTGANYSSNITTFGVVTKLSAKGSYNNFIRFTDANNSDAGTHNWGLGTSDITEDKVSLHYITAPFVGVAPGNVWNRLNGNKLFTLNTPTIMSASLNSTTGATSVGNNGNEAYATGKSGGSFVPYNFLTVGGGNSFGMNNNKTSEIIHYSRELTIQERQRVQTYLAIKYGITLDAQDNSAAIVEGDYIAGDGVTKIWDKTANATYHNNVFGIAKDDCQGLDQKQSKSVNSGFQPIISTTTFAATNVANTTSLASQGFEMIGSDAGAAKFGTSYAYAGMSHRYDRIWKVQETGTVGSVKVAVLKADFGGADQINLITSADATFGAGDTNLPMTVETIGGVQYYTATVDFTNGQYFSFGGLLTGPGGVVDTDFWVKSDDAGTIATAWKDHSSRSNPIEAVGTWSLTAANAAHNYYPYTTGFSNTKYFKDELSSLTTSNTWGDHTRTPFAVFSAVRPTGATGRIIGIDNDELFAAEPGFSISANKPYFYKYFETAGSDIHSVAATNGQSSIFSYNATQIAANSCNMQIGKDGLYENNTRTGYWHNLGENLVLGYGTWDLAGAFPGDIMEVVWYKRTLTANEQDRVNSYLAIKNGTTLAVNYLASNSTIVWNRSTSTGFNNNIFGVARDNASALHQKQSKSVSGVMALGIDNEIATSIAAHTAGVENDLNFLMVGDNNLTGTAAIAPGTACTPGSADKATNRIWKFVETGTVESTKVSTDLSSFGFNSLSTVFMQVATDAAFANVVTNIPTVYNSGATAFETNYDFTGTQYVRYVGQTTLPANVCTGASKTLNWLSFAPFDWYQWGTRTKSYNLGDGLNAKVTIDDPNNKILHGNTPVVGVKQGYYPVNYGNYLYIPRYDGNPTSTITTKIELLDGSNAKMPANAVSFKLKDIDGWYWGKDDVKVYGKLGGAIVNPKITLNKHTAITATPPTQVQGSIWPWDWTVLGDAYVNFDNPVDEIYIEYKKNNLFNFKVFNDLAIGNVNISCKAPEPEVITPDNVYLFKEVSPSTARAGEPFTYKFTFKNYNCAAKAINFTDALPTGLTFKDSTLTTSNTIGTTNAYGNTGNLNLTNLSVPVGISYMYVDAVASSTGTLNNQASFTMNGNTYQSDEPSIAGGTNPTPITIIAAPQTANLTLTKTVNKAAAPQNTNVEYTLSVTNNGASPVTTQVQDYLQGDATYTVDPIVYTPTISGQTENSYATTGTLDIRDVTIPAGATITIKVKAKLGTNPAVNDTLVNNFSVNTGLGADAATYAYKKFTSNNTKTLIQNIPSLAGTVFNDGGAGGGIPGNCIKDGTEGATGLPTGLYAKLIASGGTVALQAVAVTSGTYAFPGAADGVYTVILDDNTTLADITSTLPSGWAGTSSINGTSTGGVLSPTLTFCISNVPAQVTVVAVAGTVFNDNGTGAGIVNNCIKDGAETAAGIPAGLYAKLIKAGAVVKVEAVDANGGFTMSAVPVGTGYSMIIDNNNSYTDATSNVPANWAAGQWTGNVIATTPFTTPALKFCMNYSLPTYTVTATANTVFNDIGAGGGIAGNCIIDGTEDATGLPSPLFAKLIQAGAVVQISAVTSGGFSFTNIADGSFTIILDDNNTNTDVTTTLPSGWTGTTSWAGTITGGTPSPAMKFCLNNPPPGPCAGTSSTPGAMPAASTYITAGNVANVVNSIDFGALATGIIGTDRNPGNVGAYLFKAAAMPLNASNANFIDGYVRKTGGANVTFPVGDNGVYRPAIVNWTDPCPAQMEVAYFGVDPNIGVTSKLAAGGGGNFATAPSGGPFPTNQRVTNLFSVSNKEYWDINGTSQAEITLTWNANSDITGLSTANLNNLSIAGWNAATGKWERIASTIIAGSNLTSGSIKTDATLVPNTYNVYTFAGTIIPNLATIKTAPATISQFVPFDYSFTIKNNGTVPTTANTIVRDTLKNGLKYVSYSGAWTCAFAGTTLAGDDVVECTVYSTLAAGSSVVASLRVTPTLGGAISNTSRTSGGGMTGGPYKSSTTEASAGTPQNPNAGSSTTSTVTPIPNLVTTKVAPSTAIEQGVKFDYTLTVNNTGSVATSGIITVRDTLSNGLKYVSYTGSNWTCSKVGTDLSGNDVVVCTSSTSISANTGTSGIILTVLPTKATNISNMSWTSGGGMPGGPYKSGSTQATAGSVQNPGEGTPTGSGSNPGTATVTPKPILVTTKVGPGTAITQYQDFDYIFTVTNNGSANSTGAITILDTLRNGLIYQSTGGSGWSCNVTGSDANGNQILECTTNNVINANGDNDIVNVTVKPTKAVVVSNLAWVSGGGIPGGPYPTSPVSTTAGNALNPTPSVKVPTTNTISPIPSITTVKAALSSTTEQLTTFDYKFDLENKGSAATSGILSIRDTLRGGLKYVSMIAGSPDWTCTLVGQDLSGNDVVQCQTSTSIAAFNAATLTGGTSTYTIRVRTTLAGPITNLAWVNGGGMPNGPYKTGATPGTAGSPINPIAGSPTAPTTVTPVPILKTAKIAPSVAVQQFIPFTYNFDVLNDGGAATAGTITVKDTLKNGLVYVSGGNATWNCVVTGTDANGNQIVECTSSTAIAMATTSSFPLTVKSTTGGLTSNIAYVSGGAMPGGPYRTAPTTTNSGNPTNPTGGTATTNNVTPVSNLTTTKVAPATAITQFVPFDYTMTVTNSGGASSGGTITVRDTLKTGLKYNGYAGTGWTCAKTGVDLYGNDVVVCTYSNAIPVNGSTSFTLNVNPTLATNVTNMTWTNGGGMPGGPYKSGSTPATAGNINNPTAGGPTGTSPTTSVSPVPDLKTAKIIGSGPFNQNQPFIYNFQITNSGGISTSGLVTITDTLKNGIKFVSGGNTDWTCVKTGVDADGNDIVRCTSFQTITAGNTTSFPLQVNPTQATNTANLAWTSGGGMPGGPYKSGTTAATAGGPSNPAGGAPTATTPIGPGLPDVILLIAQPTPVLTENLQSIVQFTVTNQGNGTATGPINVNITLPTELSAPASFTSGNWSCLTAGVSISCSSQNTAGIPINTSVQFDVPVLAAIGSLGKTLSISGAIPPTTNESITNNNSATMTANNPVQTGTRPDLQTVIGTIPTLTEGVTSLIPVTVSNIGNGTATGVLTFSTNLPNGLSAPATFTQNDWTCNTSGQTVSCSNPNSTGLAPTAAVPFNIPVTPAIGSAGTTPTISGLVNQVLNEIVTNNNTGTSTAAQSVQPANRPDLQTIIGQPATGLTEGVSSNIPVILNNIGTAPAIGVLTFSTNLPNGLTAPLTFVDGAWTCNTSGQNVSCSNPNAAGLSAATGTTNFNIPITPSVGTAGQTPTVTGTASPVANETATTNNTTAMTPTNVITAMPRADLTTTIGQPAPGFTEGMTSNVPVTLANIGNAPATGTLTFSMSLPNGMTSPATFTQNGWTCNTSGQTVSCTNPNAAGLPATTGTTTFDIPVTPANGTAGSTPTLSGSSSPAPNETSTGNNTGSMTPTTPILAMTRPDVVTTIGQPAPGFTEGVASIVPVTLANIGNAPATGTLTFSTTLPNGLSAPATFTNNNWTCSTSGQTVSCTNPNAAGLPATTGTTTFDIPVTPANGTAGQTPTLTGTTSPVVNETLTTNNSTAMTPTNPITAMTRPDVVTTIGQPLPGYTEGVTSNVPVTLSNVGNAPATGQLTFSTTLPNGLSAPATFTQNNWTCNTSGQTVSCSNPNTAGLPATTGTTTFDIPVTPANGTAGQTPVIIGTTTPVANETVTTNNSTSMTPTNSIIAAARPDLTTTIGTPSPDLTEGVSSNIPITIANIGNATATGQLSFTSMLPNGITTQPTFTNNGWTCNTSGQTVSCTNPNTVGLPATTGTSTFNLTVTPSAGSAGQTPTISGTSAPVPNETVTGNNSGSLTLSTQIVAAVKPDLVISFGTPSPALAETVISNIPVTVSNIGTAAATGQLVVKINIPNNTTSLPSYASNGWTCNASGTILTCATPNVAGIAATASSTFDIKLTPMTGTAGQNIILTGLVETVTGETNTLNNNKTTIMVTPIAGPPAILINAKVMLQGAGTTVNNPYALNADGMMRADITAMLPTAQPYTALGYTNVTVKAGTPNFTGAGNNAIVDWVLVELRSSAASATVLARHAGLLQKDGDIVDIDGVSPLSIEVASGNYFVSVRHRNHLGAMTAAAISLTGTATTVDFTNPATVTYGTYAQVTIGGKNLLWAGNANTNNNVIAQGANSDRSTVTNSVTGTGANATGTNAYILSGYSTTDVNMDGKSIAKGTNADNTFILNTSLGHPNNGSGLSTFILAQQLP